MLQPMLLCIVCNELWSFIKSGVLQLFSGVTIQRHKTTIKYHFEFMKENYNNKTKLRSAWFALVLLMITALPITAQNVRDRFQVGTLWYEVVDATAKTVKVTYANEKAATSDARAQELIDETTSIPDMWKGYNGNPKQGTEQEGVHNSTQTKAVNVITIPKTVNHSGKDWTVVAIGSYAFINERGIYKVVLPETIESIEDAAFYQSSVALIDFPRSLKYIGWCAFYKTNLNPLKITTRVRGNETLYYVRPGTVTIPGATAIGPQAFEGSFSESPFKCSKITFVGYRAFKGAQFKSATIPASARIGEQPTDAKIIAMYQNLPAGTDQRSGVESFAEYYNKRSTYGLTKCPISLDDGPKTIPAGMFEKAFTAAEQFVIPTSVTSIEERAFSNTGILSFSALTVVTKIGAKAFENGVISGDFVIEEQIEEVGDGAFAGNVKLAGFTLKGSANCKIGAGLLEGCPELEYVDLRNMKSADAKSKLKNLSREFNSHTITAGLPTHTVVYLPEAAGITIADGQDVNFVKSDGTCTKLSLQDGMEYEFPYAITAKEVVYNRCNMTLKDVTIKRGDNTALEVKHYESDQSLTSYRNFSAFANGENCFTIFLPYAVKLPRGICAYDLNLLTTRQGSKNEYTGSYNTEEVYVFRSIPDGSTLKADRPYLLRIIDGNSHTSEEFKAVDSSVEIAASGNDKYTNCGRLKPRGWKEATSDQTFCFYGSTEESPRYWNEQTSQTVNNPYTLGHDPDGKDIWKRFAAKGSDPKLIPPFRGFIMPALGSTAAKQFVLLSEDSNTTGINHIAEGGNAQQGAQRIYTIDGRYVGTNFDSLPSGMYIMKGKKTLKTK